MITSWLLKFSGSKESVNILKYISKISIQAVSSVVRNPRTACLTIAVALVIPFVPKLLYLAGGVRKTLKRTTRLFKKRRRGTRGKGRKIRKTFLPNSLELVAEELIVNVVNATDIPRMRDRLYQTLINDQLEFYPDLETTSENSIIIHGPVGDRSGKDDEGVEKVVEVPAYIGVAGIPQEHPLSMVSKRRLVDQAMQHVLGDCAVEERNERFYEDYANVLGNLTLNGGTSYSDYNWGVNSFRAVLSYLFGLELSLPSRR